MLDFYTDPDNGGGYTYYLEFYEDRLEIGIISLGDMPPQSTPEFAFNEIVPQDILSNIETAMGLGNSMIVIPSFAIDTIEQEFTFNSFSNVEIENSSIQIHDEKQIKCYSNILKTSKIQTNSNNNSINNFDISL